MYYDDYSDKNSVVCSWGSKNPDSFYTGYMYINWETGEISYPKGAVIPEQTDDDITLLPNFLIVGQKELSEPLLTFLKNYLEKEFQRRNKKILERCQR